MVGLVGAKVGRSVLCVGWFRGGGEWLMAVLLRYVEVSPVYTSPAGYFAIFIGAAAYQ